MNSIRRARRRPRRESVNFRSLWWCLTRMACWHVIHGPSSPSSYRELAREFARVPTTVLVYKVRRRIKLYGGELVQ